MELTIKEINNKIYELRGQKVMIDRDLAIFYGVEPRRLREQVKRNIDRFPSDFMFQLDNEEIESMVSQNAIPSKQHLGGSLPYAFSEQGISMLSAVLKSKTAVEISIQIMRTFVEMRRYALSHNELAKRLEEVEKRVSKGEEVDTKIMEILTELIKKQNEQQLLKPSKTDGKIGFVKGTK